MLLNDLGTAQVSETVLRSEGVFAQVVCDRGSTVLNLQHIIYLNCGKQVKGPDVQSAWAVNIGLILTLAPQYFTSSAASRHLKIALARPPESLHVLNIITALHPEGKELLGSYHSS